MIELQSMTDKDVIRVEGIIEEALPNSSFTVKLDTGHSVMAYLSGKMRKNFIKVMPGDRVIAELTPYDLTKGRIVSREKVSN